MLPSSTLPRLLSGVAFLLLVGCAAVASPQDPQAPQGQYPDRAKSTKTKVTVTLVWLPDFPAVHAMCSFLMEANSMIVGCFDSRTNTIYAVEPQNFNDHFRLEILGHEFWHALGAEHPAL